MYVILGVYTETIEVIYVFSTASILAELEDYITVKCFYRMKVLISDIKSSDSRLILMRIRLRASDIGQIEFSTKSKHLSLIHI